MTSRLAGISLSVVDGGNITDRIDGRLTDLRLSEKREDDADELEFTLQNTDGKVAMPDTGVQLNLQLGWLRDAGSPIGLVDKGIFTVDEVELNGPPNLIRVRARSADLTGTLRQRRTKVWRDTNLGTILGTIAGRYGRAARIASELASLPVEVIEQEGKSDMAFLRDLGRRYDAVATWKFDVLLFLPIGASATASGTPLGGLELSPIDGMRWTARETSRDRYDGAQAQWQDQAGARRRTVTVGGTENVRKLKRVYASEAEARQAAQAAFSRDKRAPWSFGLDIAVADLAMMPDAPAKLTGWATKIDALDWIVVSVETTYSKSAGLRQKVEFESL